MFYLKKVVALVEEERAWEKLARLGEKLKVQGVEFVRGGLPAERGSVAWMGMVDQVMSDRDKPGSATCAGMAEFAKPESDEPSSAACARMAEQARSEGDEQDSAILWVTDSPSAADLLIRAEAPVLIYLHSWNQESSFPLAGFAMEEPQELEAEYLEGIYRRFAGIPWDIAATSRCLVRETIPEDVPFLQEMYRDPRVNRFLGEFPEELCGNGIHRYIQNVYGFYGYGVWTVLDRGIGEVIGRAGFQPGPSGVPELGYLIAPSRQGRGLAWEVCRALLDYASANLGFRQVQVLVHPDNAASLALCRRLGFVRDPKFAWDPEGNVGAGELLRFVLTL